MQNQAESCRIEFLLRSKIFLMHKISISAKCEKENLTLSGFGAINAARFWHYMNVCLLLMLVGRMVGCHKKAAGRIKFLFELYVFYL